MDFERTKSNSYSVNKEKKVDQSKKLQCYARSIHGFVLDLENGNFAIIPNTMGGYWKGNVYHPIYTRHYDHLIENPFCCNIAPGKKIMVPCEYIFVHVGGHSNTVTLVYSAIMECIYCTNL